LRRELCKTIEVQPDRRKHPCIAANTRFRPNGRGGAVARVAAGRLQQPRQTARQRLVVAARRMRAIAWGVHALTLGSTCPAARARHDASRSFALLSWLARNMRAGQARRLPFAVQ
jgi:hypothetical protein